ncbi:MAG TPA: flagellar protein FlgN [Gallionella sp.]|nr:flagellar protein FlgN [Gallionella sp.]
MKQSSSPQLLSTLTAERAALLKFVALLEREQKMLVENLTDQLPELSEQKSTDALVLNELAETRRALLRKNLPQLGADAIRAWLETYSQQGLVIWQEIITLAERAQRLNQANGELIQTKLRRNQQLLAVLSNAVNKANLYGPDGQASFSPGSGRSLGSG